MPPTPEIPNENFAHFVSHAKEVLVAAGHKWEISLNESGVANSGQEWDLRKIVRDGKPISCVLRKFTQMPEAHQRIFPEVPFVPAPVSKHWQDLIKAIAVEHLLVRRGGVDYVSAFNAALRYLATCSQKQPWNINSDDIIEACRLSDLDQPSGGRSIVLRGVLKSFIDPLYLFDASPLSSLVEGPMRAEKKRAQFARNKKTAARPLNERKSEEKLPEKRAFWEIMRIVFSERPRTLNDALRFAMVKTLLITGLRINEVVLLPLDWKRTRMHYKTDGRAAGDVGGITSSMSLRHFAEKQGMVRLYESTQFVPQIFETELENTLTEIARLTEPLRRTLKLQYETGRLFPMYSPDDLVDAVEIYVRITGNAIWTKPPLSAAATKCLSDYAVNFDNEEILNIYDFQRGSTRIATAVSKYYSVLKGEAGIKRYNSSGVQVHSKVKGTFVRISEVEQFIKTNMPTKMPDLKPFVLDDGSELAPWEMLFLHVKRAVGAGRGQITINPHMAFSIGIADPHLLQNALGGLADSESSLFNLYGQSDEDRQLKITSHSFRHLQNTELFRLGVADTIISKRFNRRSIAQSHEYDHRSLAEELDAVKLPNEWELHIGENKAATVAKMIHAGKANGPIVREFRQIQSIEGDIAALHFLAAEADGFHSTPYGACLNSFTVDPCPKHLECFTGCRHLSSTNLPEHRNNIINLREKLKISLDHAVARPNGSVGRANQIRHVEERLNGVDKLLSTLPGQAVFPEGPDLSVPSARRSVLDGT